MVVCLHQRSPRSQPRPACRQGWRAPNLVQTGLYRRSGFCPRVRPVPQAVSTCAPSASCGLCSGSPRLLLLAALEKEGTHLLHPELSDRGAWLELIGAIRPGARQSPRRRRYVVVPPLATLGAPGPWRNADDDSGSRGGPDQPRAQGNAAPAGAHRGRPEVVTTALAVCLQRLSKRARVLSKTPSAWLDVVIGIEKNRSPTCDWVGDEPRTRVLPGTQEALAQPLGSCQRS